MSLSLDPLTADPELVGREIRNHLDAAGIREKFCVVGIPLKWALTAQVEIPALPDSEVEGFLQIEAERSFHADINTLHYGVSRIRLLSGKQQALLAGVPKNHLLALERAFVNAKVKPVSFSVGIIALQPPVPDSAPGVLAMVIEESSVALEVTTGGGVVAARALEIPVGAEGTQRSLPADLLAREARITLGQLPADLRDSVKVIRIFGPAAPAQQLADEMDVRFESAGMKVEVVRQYHPDEFGLQLPAKADVSAAFSLAASYLVGRRAAFELLPPRVSKWEELAKRYASGKLSTIGIAAGVIVLLVIIAFAVQQVQLVRLRSQWAGMSSKVKELEGVEQQIRQYRPWYDETYRALNILKQLTTAFPEDGVVVARTVEIRDLNAVTCTGTTRDQQALLKTLERLRGSEHVADVRFGTIRGNKPPMQFTFDFKWSEGGKVAN